MPLAFRTLTALAVALVAQAQAQAQTPAPAATPAQAVPTFVEQMPIFRGSGSDSLLYYVQSTLRYPHEAHQAGAQGRVFVSFVVNKLGQVEQVKVAKGVHPALDAEAVRVVMALPTWRVPGFQNGQPVNVAFTIPLTFKISTPEPTKAISDQQATTNPDYTGPQFPGGPDSLRALVYRSTRQAGPAAPAGRVLLQFKLKKGQFPDHVDLISPPSPVDPALISSALAATNLLVAKMPAWQPSKAITSATDPDPSMSLVLDFTTPLANQPYAYADREPEFPDFSAILEVHDIAGKRVFDNAIKEPLFSSPLAQLSVFTQVSVHYPKEAQRNGESGKVRAYFEVAENGAIEHISILGSASKALDAEVLRVLAKLPSATRPALLHGQPVRIFCVMPISFRIE